MRVRSVPLAAMSLAMTVALTAGCAAPFDDDGEMLPAGSLAVAAPESATATRVVVDTDLGADDLVALALLLRHPDVSVQAVTVAATGLGSCRAGADVVADLLTALDEPALPVACGRDRRGPTGRAMPITWQYAADAGSGLPRDDGTLQPSDQPAADLIGELATSTPGLGVVALGPVTNLADLAASAPAAYRALAGVHAMAGVVEGPGQDGIGEWNVAADPESLAALLALDDGPPLTLVPADAVPAGTPDALAAPVVGAVALAAPIPAWWDLAAAAAFVRPDAVGAADTGGYSLDTTEPGRLRRVGDGDVTVVRTLDAGTLDGVYAGVFAYSGERG